MSSRYSSDIFCHIIHLKREGGREEGRERGRIEGGREGGGEVKKSRWERAGFP